MEEPHKQQSQALLLDLQSLKAITVLGRGAKGVVFLVIDDTEEALGLKVISKELIPRKKIINGEMEEDDSDYNRRIWFERDMLSLFDHPLLPKLRGYVCTDQVIGFAIQYCSGGDLNHLRRKQTEKMFSDDVIRFYAAELVLVLEYLHNMGVIYRDLKPDNILIQDNGHLMIVDFDLSTKYSVNKFGKSSLGDFGQIDRISSFSVCKSRVSPVESPEPTVEFETESARKSNSFVGTKDYIAPEILQGKGHDFAVDWWSLGVVLYEMLYGRTPFRGINQRETFHRILSKPPDMVGEKTDLRDLIGKLLEKDPSKRIAVEEIKNHDYFKGVEWNTVLQISRPPYIPVMKWDDGRVFEDVEGMDVHLVVKGIFDGESKLKNETKCENVDKNNKDSCNLDENKTDWVGSLKNPDKEDDFAIF